MQHELASYQIGPAVEKVLPAASPVSFCSTVCMLPGPHRHTVTSFAKKQVPAFLTAHALQPGKASITRPPLHLLSQSLASDRTTICLTSVQLTTLV